MGNFGYQLGTISRLNARRSTQGKRKGRKTSKEMIKEGKKYMVILHRRFHWSFAVIDNTREKKLSTYDSGIQVSGSHKRPNHGK